MEESGRTVLTANKALKAGGELHTTKGLAEMADESDTLVEIPKKVEDEKL